MITDAEINAVLARVDALLDECFPYRERQSALKPVVVTAAEPPKPAKWWKDGEHGLGVKAHVEPAKRPPGGVRLQPKVLDEISF
jgi:hypothetical protein